MGYESYKSIYREQSVNSATPLQLVIMLYDGADRFLEAARISMEQKNLNKQDENLQKAQKIILQLMSSLDMQNGGEVAKNLLALYSYCVNQLVEANMYDQKEPIARVRKILGELKTSWISLSEQFDVVGESPLAA